MFLLGLLVALDNKRTYLTFHYLLANVISECHFRNEKKKKMKMFTTKGIEMLSWTTRTRKSLGNWNIHTISNKRWTTFFNFTFFFCTFLLSLKLLSRSHTISCSLPSVDSFSKHKLGQNQMWRERETIWGKCRLYEFVTAVVLLLNWINPWQSKRNFSLSSFVAFAFIVNTTVWPSSQEKKNISTHSTVQIYGTGKLILHFVRKLNFLKSRQHAPKKKKK